MSITIKLNEEGLIDLTVTNFNFSLYKTSTQVSNNSYDFNLLPYPYNYTINPAYLKEDDYEIKAKILDESKVEFKLLGKTFILNKASNTVPLIPNGLNNDKFKSQQASYIVRNLTSAINTKNGVSLNKLKDQLAESIKANEEKQKQEAEKQQLLKQQQLKQKQKLEAEVKQKAEAEAKQKAFEEAQKALTEANDALQDELKKFNKEGKDADDLLIAVKAVQDKFKALNTQSEALNKLGGNQKTEISAEFTDQKLYADFLGVNLKPKGQDQPDYMKGLSGKFYKPFERLSKILEDNKNQITVIDNINKILEGNKDKGFAFGGQIENNLEIFFKRLEEKIKNNKGPKTLQEYCKSVALTLDSDTGTGKTMFVDSLLGSTEEKNKYFTNQQENGNFKKEGLGALGACIYGENREKIVIHCGQDIAKIKEQINLAKGGVIALDEWHRLNKEQKKELNSLLKGEKVIKITATPTDGLYKVLKRSEQGKETKQNLLSKKEDRKNKVLQNVASAQDFAQLELKEEYCLSIIDAEGSLEKTNKDGSDTGNIININIDFSNENKKPQIIIFPPDEKGEYLVYTTSEENVNEENTNDEKYKQEKWDKNRLADELKIKTRIFQVFGSNGTQKGQTRGSIDGGDYGTSGIANQKILFYSFDSKIMTDLEGLLKSDNVEQSKKPDNKEKAQLVNLINKYDEFIVQAYGRARADTTDITFHDPEAKTLHDQIQDKKAELLKDGVFKTTINGKETLVDYQSFVDRFNKNLPEAEDRNKIITQAFLKIASEEDDKKEGLLKVAVEAVGDKSEFNKVYNIIKSLSKKQREVLMDIGGYDKELLEQQNALETIQATIKSEIEAKRKINKETKNNNYSDFRVDNKIEDGISIKIDKEGKVSLLGVEKVSRFESKEYLNKNPQEKDTILNEADANAFKGHIDRINIVIDIEKSVSEYQEIIDKLKNLNLSEDGKKNIEKEAKSKIEAIKEQYKTKLDEKQLESIISKLKDSSQDSSKINEMANTLEELQNKNNEMKKEFDDAYKQKQIEMSKNINELNSKNQDLIVRLEQQEQKETENQQKLVKESEAIKELQKEMMEQKNKDNLKRQELTKKLSENLEEKDLLQKVYEEAEQAFEDFKNGLSSFFSVSAVNTLEEIEKKIKQLQEQQKLTQEQLEAKNKELEDKLNEKDQEIKQMQKEQSEKLKEEGKKFQTHAELNEKLEEEIALILKNKGSDGNIDALFDGENLKTLYHTAGSFEEIGQSNLECNYEEDYYKSFLEKNNDKQDPKASEEVKSDQDKFDLLRKSIIQSSAIRDKHSILQEVLQEKGLKIDNLDKYSFKSLDKLIDGDNFKDEFKEDLKNLGFGEGENGIWAKGKGGDAVKYDTNQPYVKDFLINAYYEENFNKFQETLEKSLVKDKSATLDELKKSAVERYNAKQKLEFVKQINNYSSVVKFNETKVEGANIDHNQLNDYIQIANIIKNNNQDYKTRFEFENQGIKKLEEKMGVNEGIKIEVGKSASLLVNPNILKGKSEQEENVPDYEAERPNKVNSSKEPVFLLKVNQGLLHMIEEYNNKVSPEVNSDSENELKSNSTNESLDKTPHSIIEPKGLESFLEISLRSSYESIKGLLSTQSTDKNNSDLPNDDQNNQNEK